jgi:deoxyribose-phosphate aldolase
MKRIDIAAFIDQSCLRADATHEEIERLCEISLDCHFHAVFINPVHVGRVTKLLKASPVRTGSVVGFPLGAVPEMVKVFEAETIENDGAHEIDMVINIGAAKSGDLQFIEKEIHAVRRAISGRTTLKVILECSLLTHSEKLTCAKIATDCGADFVKTGTGTAGDATTSDVEMLFDAVGNLVGIKAAGGIRDLKSMLSMIEAGASRIGTSSGKTILNEYLNSIEAN